MLDQLIKCDQDAYDLTANRSRLPRIAMLMHGLAFEVELQKRIVDILEAKVTEKQEEADQWEAVAELDDKDAEVAAQFDQAKTELDDMESVRDTEAEFLGMLEDAYNSLVLFNKESNENPV